MKAAAIAVLLLMLPWLADAEQSRDRINVVARVLPHVSLEALQEPSALDVSENDLERGFVEARARYAVQTNARDGYTLRFAPRVGLADRILIHGLGSPVVLGDLEVDVLQAAAAAVVELSFRIELGPGLIVGSYPWPVSVTASADWTPAKK